MNAYPTVSGPDPDSDPNLSALLSQLQKRLNGAVCCTLVYGSCLRSGNIYDGLLDLYLVCDDYRSAYSNPRLAAANWLLPPNVFYAEQKSTGAAGSDLTLRSKVTVISLRDFERGCSNAWFESYIWGRFAQPTHILHARDGQTRARMEAALTQAALTLLVNALPALPPQGRLEDLWVQALGMSYNTELRTERSGRARELVLDAADFYAALTRHHAPQLGPSFALRGQGSQVTYRSSFSPTTRRWIALAWAVRRAQGKLLSIMRLVKGLFTFDGGLDYIAWKLERHSGEKIVIPDRVRRMPLVHMWGFFWGLYRRGIFK